MIDLSVDTIQRPNSAAISLNCSFNSSSLRCENSLLNVSSAVACTGFPKARSRIALAADTDARASLDRIQCTRRSIASGVCLRASSRTSAGTPTRPPGFPDCPFFQVIDHSPRYLFAANNIKPFAAQIQACAVALVAICRAKLISFSSVTRHELIEIPPPIISFIFFVSRN